MKINRYLFIGAAGCPLLIFLAGYYIFYRPIRVNSPTEAPLSTLSLKPAEIYEKKFGTPDEFLRASLGDQYFADHLQSRDIEDSEYGKIKAAYSFSFVPHVNDLHMVLLFDKTTGNLDYDQTSTILLEPQEFVLSKDEAVNLAKNKGMIKCDDYRAEVRIYRNVHTGVNNRLAWEVAGVNGCPELTSKNQGVVIRMIIDVENKIIYATEKNEPTQAL